MITILTGESSFDIEQSIRAMKSGFDGSVETIDGSELELKQLPDLLMGGTLFADKRLVIIKQLSDSKSLWSEFGAWIDRVSDDIQLVLIEKKLDKRTATYKALVKRADIREYKAWTDRETGAAEQWITQEALSLGATLDKKCAHLVVSRVGVDKWALHHALQKLAVLDHITLEVIEVVIEAHPVENVFNLFEAALRGEIHTVSQMIATLSLTEDPYRLFGLLSGQAFQLATLGVADQTQAEVAKDLGVHPYGLSKLAGHAKRLGKLGARKVITAFAEADAGMKTSSAEPWLLIERALMRVGTLA
jgi:DNA polymerase III delta subunit